MFINNNKAPAKLILRDDNVFEGFSFGASESVAGEVVFATGMVGYPEALTDPSYTGQILVFTYPMIGNYGVPSLQRDAFGITKHFESQDGKIHVSALVVSEYCDEPVHWQKLKTLGEWLKSQNVPGLMMVDTRNIVLKLREMGTALGKIVVENKDIPFFDPNTKLLTAVVSTKKKCIYGHGNITILCIDMGIKLNLIRCLLRYDTTVVVVPHDWDITQEHFDGIFVSNGPGNPEMCHETIRSLRWAICQDNPIFGVCMGNQILALAAGASTYKMKYGHRGQNQPCRFVNDGRVLITTQNHGFAVDMSTLPTGWEQSWVNPNDKSNEGIRHKTKPFSAVQYHPEGRCGPQDTEFLIRDFVDQVKKYKIQKLTEWTPKKVLVLGAGGITIAQAGEFDYSGSQCLKSLREEGIETILVNPNIATVQTDDEMADHIYFVPVTPEAVERVIEKERPDGIMLGWGGQTALNCGIKLDELGILKKYNVRVLGSQVSVITVTEDRELFRDALLQINEHVAESKAVSGVEQAILAAHSIGYPVMVRAAFCLGGQGSGIVENDEQLREKTQVALASSPQVLIEQSLAGWKEIEYEVVRDVYDNCITVCNMENFDPMGVHTGESIVIAPSQTLTNDEYHMLRTTSIKIIRHLGVIGECNIQYGLDPNSHRYAVIEVNARLSRSSALASKATGYPLAHVATKLALGKHLPSIINGVTKTTTACFEPSLDYCALKVPRWDLNKFNMISNDIGSMMKSVGEVMAIGRTFEEVIQKALRMVDNTVYGFDFPSWLPSSFDYIETIKNPTPYRIWAICKALHEGVSVDQIWFLSKINKFFLYKLRNIVQAERQMKTLYRDLSDITKDAMIGLKGMGFSDYQIAKLLNTTDGAVRKWRHNNNIVPFVKQIDTVAGEIAAKTNYLYTSYNANSDDVEFTDPHHVVLGCGVYRIGNSVEFDYGSVLVARELRRLGHKLIMINYNPETVSTDYDECDRLYFEEISLESVLDILFKERSHGVIISVGGQIVQNFALHLQNAGVHILGTDPKNIDIAEDRNKFSKMCDDIGVSQPEWVSATSLEEVHKFCNRIGFPCLVRPSYVLSGSAMSVISCLDDIDVYLKSAAIVSGKYPTVVSKYYENAKEFDVDVVAHHGKVLCYSIAEHIENAGVHSGDATMFLPPQDRDKRIMKAIYDSATKISERLDIVGPMNVQFLLTNDGRLKVIEANVRSSRSIPFVSKTLGISFSAVMVNAFLSRSDQVMVPIKRAKMSHIGCKAGMFSFNRLAGADPILGVEMHSTGEVGVFGRDKYEVLLKAMLCQNFKYPKRAVLISIEDREEDALAFAPYAKMLSSKLMIYATSNTAKIFEENGLRTNVTYLTEDNASPCYTDIYINRNVDLVIQLRDTTKDFQLRRCTAETAPESYKMRRMAIDYNIPLITDNEIAKLFSEAFIRYTPADIEIEEFKSYVPKIYHKLENNNCTLLRRHKVGLCVDNSLDSRVLSLCLRSQGQNVICFHADVGQGDNAVLVLQDEYAGANLPVEIVDLRDQIATACYELVLIGAAYEHYLFPIGNMARHVICSYLIPAMRNKKITVAAQASRRGNREIRFEKYVKSICPEMGVYTPWRDQRMIEEFPTDEYRSAYVIQHSMRPIIPGACRIMSNLGGILQIPKSAGALTSGRLMVKDCKLCGEEPEFTSIEFVNGCCIQINGMTVTPMHGMHMANTIAARNGIGLTKTTEGMVYECPGLTLLSSALRYLYEEIFDGKSMEMMKTYCDHITSQTAAGDFADSSTQSALHAIRFLAEKATGIVNLELHRGQAIFLKTENVKNSLKVMQAIKDADADVFMRGNGSFSDFEW